MKIGIDDYIVAKGLDSFIEEVLLRAVEWDPSRELWKVNEEVAYVRDPGLIFRIQNRQRMSVRNFTDHAYSHRTYIDASGNTPRRMSVAKEWVRWPNRAEVKRITYRPGAPLITEDNEINVWPGWAVNPINGPITLWLELLKRLIPEYEYRRWFEQWLAYPLQRPGTKLFTAVVLWSRVQGNGKTTVGYSMKDIYGDNFREVGDLELFGNNFNDWAENRQLVMGDEISGHGRDKSSNSDRIKSLITQKDIRINQKYLPPFTVCDCINYLFTSNHPDAFYIDDFDRRFFVYEVLADPDPEWFKKYYSWNKNGGASAIFHHLLHVDLNGFDPHAPAPETAAKREMREMSSGTLRAWVRLLRENPDKTLKTVGKPAAPPCILWTAEELLGYFKPNAFHGREDSQSMGRALAAAGFRKAPFSRVKTKVRNLHNRDGNNVNAYVWYIRPQNPSPTWLFSEAGVRKQYEDERRRYKESLAQSGNSEHGNFQKF